MLNLTKVMFALPLYTVLGLTGCNKADQAPVPKATTTDKAPVSTVAPAGTTTTASVKESPEDAHKAREKLMKEWGSATKTMGGMIKDPTTFKADTFKAEAQKLSNEEVWSHFGDGTKAGDAKAEIWSKPAEFQAEINKYKTAVTALNAVASNATSADAVKAAFGEVGASCKSCHQGFRED